MPELFLCNYLINMNYMDYVNGEIWIYNNRANHGIYEVSHSVTFVSFGGSGAVDFMAY